MLTAVLTTAFAAQADPFPISQYPSLAKIVEETKRKDLSFIERKLLLSQFSEEALKLAEQLPSELSTQQLDRALPILELKSLLFDFSVDQVRQGDCARGLSIIVNHSGRDIVSKAELDGASAFLYQLVESNCR